MTHLRTEKRYERSLNEAGKERLKDMVKNPLRLALLCNTWNLWQEQGGLPDTKAKLTRDLLITTTTCSTS
jgi:predicted NACHT family NTPase